MYRIFTIPVLFAATCFAQAQCTVDQVPHYVAANSRLECVDPADLGVPTGSIPAGAIILIVSGSCPSGFDEATELNGLTVIGTLAANGDVGTTGGSDIVTPIFSGAALATHIHAAGSFAAAGQTFLGDVLATHIHAAGSFVAGAQTVNSLTAAAQTVNSLTAAAQALSGSSSAEASHTHGVGSFANGAISLSGSTAAEAAHTHTVGSLVNTWPAGVPTFAGTLSTVVVNHVHTLATGTTATGNFSQVLGTVDTTSGGTGGIPTQTALGTLSGNPTAGGAANYTPAGILSWPAGVPTLSGTSSAGSSHLHAVGTLAASTPSFSGTSAAGSSHLHGVGTLANAASAVTGTMNSSAVTGTMNSSAVSGTSDATSGGTPSGTNSASAVSGTSAATSAGIPAGTIADLDNRSAFVKVIFCKKV